MAVLDNPRWETFVQQLIAGETRRAAYRMAFTRSNRWKNETIDSKASNLFANDKVRTRYNELQEQAQDAAIMSRKERMVALSKIAVSLKVHASDQIKAIDTLNKMDGDYIDRVELSGQVKQSDPYKGLTEDELRKLADDADG